MLKSASRGRSAWSGRGVHGPGGSVVSAPRGGSWSGGGLPGLGGVSAPGGVPGPGGCACSQRGSAWFRRGVPAPGGVYPSMH